MKITVTGGAGFIGSNLVRAILTEGHEVCVIDDLRRGRKNNVLNVAESEKAGLSRLKTVWGDIRNQPDLEKAIRGAEVVFHLAALKNTVCRRQPTTCMDINVCGTLHVLNLCIRYNVKRFILASSASVYGPPKTNLQGEGSPTFPVSIYGISKLAAEHCTRLYHRQHGLATTVLRYCHVYGPRCDASEETGDVIPIFIRSLWDRKPPDIHGDGLQQRSFTYVDDVVKCSLLAMENDAAIGKTYNCASGGNVSVRDMVDKLRWLMNREDVEPVFSEWRALAEVRKISKISNWRIGDELGMTRWTPIDRGLKKTIGWYVYGIQEEWERGS